MIRLVLFAVASLAAQVGNLNTYAIPAVPSLPAAGGTYVDSTFGTTVMRITDAGTDGGGYCYHDYAYWDVFNLDNTKLTVSCSSPARYWFEFNPLTFTLGAKHSFPNTPDGVQPTGDSVLQWSSLYSNRALVIGVSSMKIFELNVDTGIYTTLKTFTTGLPTGTTSISTTSIDRQDNVFSILTYGGSGVTGCMVWQRSTDTILYTVTTSNTHSCLISKTGRYFLIQYDITPPDGAGIHVVDLQNGNLDTGLTDDAPDYGPRGHKDFSTYGIASFQPYWPSPYGAKTWRLLTALTATSALTGLSDSDGHVSCRNDDGEWCTSEYYRVGSDGIPPIQQEIFSYSLDGYQRVRRYVHHHSSPDVAGTDAYRAQPQANISRDGRFVTFNSTMGPASDRIDVYVSRGSLKAAGMSGAF